MGCSHGCSSEDGCNGSGPCLNWNQVSLASLGLLGQREVREGEHGERHACTVLEAPVANTFPFVTPSHVWQGKRKLLLQRIASFKSGNFQLASRKTPLAHESPKLFLMLEWIHVKQMSERIRSMQTY